MKNGANINIETIKLKDVKEKIPQKNQIPTYFSSYFQSITLQDLSSYDNDILEEMSKSNTLFGNNYFKYFMKNKDSSRKKCTSDRPKKFGNLYTFLFFKNRPLFTIGTRKLYLIIIYELFLHITFFLVHLHIIHVVFGYMQYLLTIFYFFCFVNHMFLVLFNPGIPRPENFSKDFMKTIKKEDRKYFRVCEICNIIVDQSDGVRHCTECNVCMNKLDHHCYWTGKCIAKNNYLTFHLFTFTTLLYYVWYALVIFVYVIIKMSHSRHKN